MGSSQALLWDSTETTELVILKNKQASKQKNSCQVGLCMWMLPVVLSPDMVHGGSVGYQCSGTVFEAAYATASGIYVKAGIQCQVSGIFCVWYFHLPLRVVGTLLWNKISPDFCCKHSIDRNLWSVLLPTWVCSGAFLVLSETPDFE